MPLKASKTIKKVTAAVLFTSLISVGVLWFGSPHQHNSGIIVSWVQSIENIFYDSYFKWKTTQGDDTSLENESVVITENYDPHIFIVDIDEPSLSKLGNYNEWQRKIHADRKSVV